MINENKMGVVAVLIKNNKILMVEDSRPKVKGWWGPPHGVISLDNETEEEGLKRKTFQEIGVEVVPIRRLFFDKADTKTVNISFWLIELKEDKPLKIEKEGNLSYNWFTLDEALKLKLYPATKKFLQQVKTKIIDLPLS